MPQRPAARLVALLLAPVALAACSTAAPPQLRGPESGAVGPAPDDASVYGLYLAGETALESGASRAAADYLGAAAARAPDVGELGRQAFVSALLAGEVERAASIAPSPGKGDPGAYALGQITRAAVAMSKGQDRQAAALLAPADMGDHWAAASLLRPWAAAAAGDWSAAVAAASPATQDRAVEAFAQLNRARLLEKAGKFADAEAAYRAQATRSGVFTLAYGGFLERRGRRAEALAVYDKALAKDPADPAFSAARTRVAANAAPPPAPSIRSGAAQALIGPAALLLSQKQSDAGLAYLRLALTLDPELWEGWVLVGDALETDHDLPGARAAYARVPASSPEYATARGRMALDLQEEDDKPGALAVAQSLATARPNDPHSLLVLADLYRDDERYPEAVATLDRLIAAVPAQTASDWRLYYLRGSALEREGKWPEAQADLQKALAQKPDDPEILNYLGFAWADRGERLDEAVRLLQKAVTLEPDQGAYLDSLGWAHYRQGVYPLAVTELEHAASLDPSDPDINNHLGDAYWRTGRRLEAQYQWRRVLTLEPEPATRTAVTDKLAHGLPAGPAVAAQGGAPGATQGAARP